MYSILSQMFIWHDGAWHRALRYVYTTPSSSLDENILGEFSSDDSILEE